MAWVENGAEERARQRDLVRRGYDQISLAYRSDDGTAPSSPAGEAGDVGEAGDAGEAGDVGRYTGWVAELAGLLPSGADCGPPSNRNM